LDVTDRIVPASMKHHYERFHFAPAVRDGDRLFCSGQLGARADGSVPDDVEEQFTLAFQGVAAVLAEAGCTLADVIEMTSYHVDLHAHLRLFQKVKDRFVAEPYPAWTAIGISALAFPGALVEIRVVARAR
jgi:enamine deaminase RidA (YjgF/YER057c/UK114 family)